MTFGFGSYLAVWIYANYLANYFARRLKHNGKREQAISLLSWLTLVLNPPVSAFILLMLTAFAGLAPQGVEALLVLSLYALIPWVIAYAYFSKDIVGPVDR